MTIKNHIDSLFVIMVYWLRLNEIKQTKGYKMKKLILAAAVAFTTSVSFAQDINFKKINNTLKKDIVAPVLEANQGGVISALEFKIDEKSQLQNLKTLKTGISLSATAKESAWSTKPSTVGVALNAQTQKSDAIDADLKIGGAIESKTDAVSLYRYVAQYILKNENEIDHPAFKELLVEAAQTTRLSEIPAQLEKLVIIIKNSLNDEEDATWSEFLNSLVVDKKINNFQTTEVILKTTAQPAVNFFGMKLVLSDLSLSISNFKVNFGGSVVLTLSVDSGYEFLETVQSFLMMIEHADNETKADLRDMATSYLNMVERLVKGE